MSVGNVFVDNDNKIFCGDLSCNDNVDCVNIDLTTINGKPYNAGAVSGDACYLRRADTIAAPVVVATLQPIIYLTSLVSGGITYNNGTGVVTLADIGLYCLQWQYHTAAFGSHTSVYLNNNNLGAQYSAGTNYNGTNAFEYFTSQEVMFATPSVNSTIKIVNTAAVDLLLLPADIAAPSVYASLTIKRIL